MNLALVQELSADGLPCPTFKKDIVRNDDGSSAVLLE
jgi:hypothetical protein